MKLVKIFLEEIIKKEKTFLDKDASMPVYEL